MSTQNVNRSHMYPGWLPMWLLAKVDSSNWLNWLKWIELNRYRGIWIHVRICAFVWQAGGSCNHFRQELSNDPDEPSLPSDD